MNVVTTRRHALGLMGSVLLLPGCGRNGSAVRIGSTDSTENATIAEIYAIALERQHIPVARHMRVGDDTQVLRALERGDLDLYPGHVPNAQPAEADADIVRLTPSPAFDSPCLVTSQYFAEKYWLLTLSECARIAPQLRLAASTDFLSSGSLERLQRLYGGLNFRQVIPCEPGAQTYVVARGDAEVGNSETMEPKIQEERLVILLDDKRYWPELHITPIVRIAALHVHPRIRATLNGVSPALTQVALQQMNLRRQLLDLEPYDVAGEFVRHLSRQAL